MNNNHSQLVLIVEDEQPLLEVISERLTKKGFRIVSARSVAESFDLLASHDDVTAIWLDHYLYGKENGLDLLEKIRKDRKWKNVPVFVVTNTGSPDKVSAYNELRVTKYYTKSDYGLDAIINEIAAYLKKNHPE